MKLKRMWPGLCILIVFILFDVVMVASSSFFSGLFPLNDMRLTYSIALTVLGVLIMSILTFLLGRICDHIDLRELSETIGVKVIYVLMLIAIFVGGVFYRLDAISRSTASPAGKLSLYENAQVGNTLVNGEYDLLSIVYSSLLRCVLFFTGNKLLVSYFFQIALFMIFVVLGTVTARLLLGKAAAVTFAAYTSFMPIFVEDLSKCIIGTNELFLVLLGIELLVISIYLKNISDGKYTSGWFVLWFIFVGIVVGFMTYLDAGTIVAVLPLLLSALFMAGDYEHKGPFSFIFVVLAGVVTFFAMIVQEAGFSMFVPVLKNWGQYYFRNVMTFSMFWTYTNYKIIYVITFIVMSGVLVGFFRNKNFGRVSPWLLSTILVFMATPFFGATRMNDQLVVTIFFAFVIACVVSLITLTKKEAVYKFTADEDKSDLQREAESMVTGTKVVEPDVRIKEKVAETESIPVEEIPKEHTDGTPVESTSKETEASVSKKSEENAPRFVPEGMVLPMGSEDEMDIEKSNMKMPEFKGKIALNSGRVKDDFDKDKMKMSKEEIKRAHPTKHIDRNKLKNKVRPEEIKRDDFDLPYKEGDDFDI